VALNSESIIVPVRQIIRPEEESTLKIKSSPALRRNVTMVVKNPNHSEKIIPS